MIASGLLVEKILYAPVTAKCSRDIISSMYLRSSSANFFHDRFGGFPSFIADPFNVIKDTISGVSLILLCGLRNSLRKMKEESSSPSSDIVSSNRTYPDNLREGVDTLGTGSSDEELMDDVLRSSPKQVLVIALFISIGHSTPDFHNSRSLVARMKR